MLVKKYLGIILILIGFAFVFVLKVGPAEETLWMFTYGDWPLLLLSLLCLIPGLVLYNRYR
jgi:hypothetical protein